MKLNNLDRRDKLIKLWKKVCKETKTRIRNEYNRNRHLPASTECTEDTNYIETIVKRDFEIDKNHSFYIRDMEASIFIPTKDNSPLLLLRKFKLKIEGKVDVYTEENEIPSRFNFWPFNGTKTEATHVIKQSEKERIKSKYGDKATFDIKDSGEGIFKYEDYIGIIQFGNIICAINGETRESLNKDFTSACLRVDTEIVNGMIGVSHNRKSPQRKNHKTQGSNQNKKPQNNRSKNNRNNNSNQKRNPQNGSQKQK